MNKEEGMPPGIVPLEKGSRLRREFTDNATKKMIALMKTAIGLRFALTDKGTSVDFQTMRFVDLSEDGFGSEKLNASLRVTSADYVLKPNDPLEIITGMCMFGASGLIGVSATGEEVSFTDPLQEIPKRFQAVSCKEADVLHPSEVEAVKQLTQAINLLTLTDRGDSSNIHLRFHMPIQEYKLYMVDKLQKGQMAPELFAELLAVIDRRAKALAAIIQKRVLLPVKLEDPLNPIGGLIEKEGGNLSLVQSVMVLSRDELMHQLIMASPPKTFLELCRLSYTAEYFRVAHDAEFNKGGALAVESAEEEPIFSNAKKIAAETGLLFNMAALYVLPQAVTARGKHGKQDLFMHTPNGVGAIAELIELMRILRGGSNEVE